MKNIHVGPMYVCVHLKPLAFVEKFVIFSEASQKPDVVG